MESDSEHEMSCTPPEITEAAKITSLDLLPAKSQKVYVATYKSSVKYHYSLDMLFTKVLPRKWPRSMKQISLFIKPSTASYSSSSTVDANEVSQFTKLSPIWWDELGEMKPLHSLNSLRVPLVRDGLINTGAVKKELVNTPKPLKDMLILEVGCGGGILTESLARLGPTITGLDVTPDLLELAIKHAALDSSLSNLKYSLESVEEHTKNNSEKYDAVVTSEVLEHITEKDLFLEACVKCLKPGGSIFITTLNKTTFSWLGAIVVAENIMNCVPRGTHEWNKFIAPHQTQRLLEDNNCRTKLVHGMCYNFFTNRWDWIQSTSVSYALHAVKDKV